jgi:hypothetical protein
LVFFISFTITGLGAQAQDIRSIDRYVKRIDRITQAKRSPDLVFADVSLDSKPRWRKFRSAKSLETYRTRSEVYTIFYNYLYRGRIGVAVLTDSSQSGDWVHYVSYYFRRDGSLAKIVSDYRTFVGDYVGARNIYFDRKGKVLKRTTRYLTLRDRVPTKPTADELRDNGPMMTIITYRSVRRLPFSRLIRIPK